MAKNPTPRVNGLKADASAAPGSFPRLMADFRLWMQVRNMSPHTSAIRLQSVGLFAVFLADRSVFRPCDVNRPMVEAYQRSLTRHIKANGHPMAAAGQYQRMRGLAAFFSWLHRKGHIPANPAADLELPRLFRSLPHHLTREEVEAIFRIPNVFTASGQCDRAMLEVLYSTGLRRAEAAKLRLDDLDPQRGLVRVVRGKGGKDRMAPIGARALQWCDHYIRHGRAETCREVGEFQLFLNDDGTRMSLGHFGARIKKIMIAAGITKPGACHLFRHTFATHLLENGCDIRHIQGMLGHEGIEMTARYAQVTARQLIAAHAMFHRASPGAE